MPKSNQGSRLSQSTTKCYQDNEHDEHPTWKMGHPLQEPDEKLPMPKANK
jgi:hypothetical protein